MEKDIIEDDNRIPWVTFCMSTYKRPVFLKQQIATILKQTFTDFSVIISDNDPEASGKDIVASFNDPRLQYSANESNLGMIKSFNRSLARAKSEYVVMITDDDPVYPDMLQTLQELSLQYPGYGIYFGGCDWFCVSHEVGKLYNFKVGTNSCLSDKYDIDYKQAFSPDEFLKQIFSFGIFPHYLWSTCIVKRDILIKIGGIPDYGTPFLGDYAYLSAAGSHSGCVIINRALGCQTLHNENFGRNQNDQIVIAAKQFPAYLESKASHLLGWEDIKKRMLRFTALWTITHMAFLYSYYKKTGAIDQSLNNAEKEVFKISYIKKYRIKYFLKRSFPFVHDLMVRIKRQIKG